VAWSQGLPAASSEACPTSISVLDRASLASLRAGGQSPGSPCSTPAHDFAPGRPALGCPRALANRQPAKTLCLLGRHRCHCHRCCRLSAETKAPQSSGFCPVGRHCRGSRILSTPPASLHLGRRWPGCSRRPQDTVPLCTPEHMELSGEPAPF
jgi:hypothetical protein